MSFADILKRTANTVEAPKPVPVGTYLAVIDTGAKIDQERGTVDFPIKIMAAQADVDPAQVAEFGGVTGTLMRITRWFIAKEETEEAQARTDYGNKKFFVETLGLDEHLSFGEMIAQAPGHQLMVTVKHVPSKDGTQMYANIAGTARA